jgi:hypothetical protein
VMSSFEIAVRAESLNVVSTVRTVVPVASMLEILGNRPVSAWNQAVLDDWPPTAAPNFTL